MLRIIAMCFDRYLDTVRFRTAATPFTRAI